MQGVDSLYLGWNQPRRAFIFPGHSIVVLIDGEVSVVLKDQEALNFRTKIREITHHLCGVAQTPWSRAVIADHPGDEAYTVIFREYFT